MTTIKSVILEQRSSVETTQQKSEVSTNEGTSVEDVMTFITALRKKHHPLVDVQCSQCSTVGLVVEGGRHISAVVPGGPCDREFNGGLIETGDNILLVDGKKYVGKELLAALVGDDVVGSTVQLTIEKTNAGGRTLECAVERGALARIHAVGQLFLLLSELIADIDVDEKHATVGDMLRVESQAKIVNDVTNVFLTCFKNHVHDLEEELFEMLHRSRREMFCRTETLNKIAAVKSAEGTMLVMRVEQAEASQRAAMLRESRRERTDQALQKEIDMLKLDVEGATRVSRELESQLKELKNRAGAGNTELMQTKNKLVVVEGQLALALSRCCDSEVRLKDSTAYSTRGDQVLVSTQGELKSAQQKVESLGAQLVASRRDCEEHMNTIHVLKSEGELLKGELSALKQQLSEASSGCDAKVQDLTLQLESRRNSHALLLQELDHKGQTLTTIHGAYDALKTELVALKSLLSERSSEAETLRQKLSATSQKLEEEREELKKFRANCTYQFEEFRANCRSEFETLGRTFLSISRELEQERVAMQEFTASCKCSALKSECGVLQADLVSTAHELEKERETCKKLRAQCRCDSLKSQFDTCAEDRDRLVGERDRLKMMEAELRATCDKCQCETLQFKLDQALETLDVLQKKLKPRFQLA